MKILCIGNGNSLRERLHIVNDTYYDFKIGTKYQYREFKVNCIAVADKGPAEIISNDYTGDIITKWNTRDNFIVPSTCLLYTSPSPRDATLSRMPSSA